MHYIEKADKYVLEPNPCQSLPIAICRELSQLLKMFEPGKTYRVDLRVDGCLRGTAVEILRSQLSYFGHKMKVIWGTKDIEIEVAL